MPVALRVRAHTRRDVLIHADGARMRTTGSMRGKLGYLKLFYSSDSSSAGLLSSKLKYLHICEWNEQAVFSNAVECQNCYIHML